MRRGVGGRGDGDEAQHGASGQSPVLMVPRSVLSPGEWALLVLQDPWHSQCLLSHMAGTISQVLLGPTAQTHGSAVSKDCSASSIPPLSQLQEEAGRFVIQGKQIQW